jgi:hypothetical protein
MGKQEKRKREKPPREHCLAFGDSGAPVNRLLAGVHRRTRGAEVRVGRARLVWKNRGVTRIVLLAVRLTASVASLGAAGDTLSVARAEATHPSSSIAVGALLPAQDAGLAEARLSPAPKAEQPAQVNPEEARARAAGRALLASLAPKEGQLPVPEPVFDPARTVLRASALGIAPAPPLPKARKTFAFAADDPAGEAARMIAERVRTFPNFRAQAPGAVWREDPRARFAIRATDSCLSELEHSGIRAHPPSEALTTPVAVPVVIDAPISGVMFVSLHADREIVLSCEMARRLLPLARILRRQGVLAVGINSSYRDRPKVSFHTFGLALDMMAFRTHDSTLVVAEHFEASADAHTCQAEPSSEEGKALLGIVCAIADSHLFSTILTPNYNEGHRDHVHLDARPDDPRLFLR